MEVSGYKESVTDEQVIRVIEQGITNSAGDWLNSSEMTEERKKATYEYAGMPKHHLTPNGVSSIVATDTTETVEAYLAIISELMFSNNRIARFVPYNASPAAQKAAEMASKVTNYCIFKKNKGWELLNTWVKASLLWKNAIIRWDYIEDENHTFEEFDEIPQEALDLKLSDPDMELVGDLETDAMGNYLNVRLKRTINNSRVKLENVPPENFRITRQAQGIHDAEFVGIQVEMTRSEIRAEWPEIAEDIEDWSKLTSNDSAGYENYNPEAAARADILGQAYWSEKDGTPLEANYPVNVTECWLRVDRDGDGIAELKHFIVAGTTILFEEDVNYIPLCSICPFEVPHEFYGLSVADMARSSTLASTAILRGFVENTYLTNYSPKLADPNVVDFSALQNMKPKDLIPTNGNPTAAVAALPPEQISSGTVPILDYLQKSKEQATGMTKAAQGIQDELYVSGNSEVKLQQVMSASQKRIQHVVRRFAETGFKELCEGVYKTMKDNMEKTTMNDPKYGILDVDFASLPEVMEVEVDVDLGENSNSNVRDKLTLLATQFIPLLKEAGAGDLIKPDAFATIAHQLLTSMDLSPSDYLKDHQSEEFLKAAQESMEKQGKEAEELKKIAKEKEQTEIEQNKANVRYTNVQSDNSLQDNARQLAIAIDTHFQKWADMKAKAEKDGITLQETPGFDQIVEMSKQILTGISPERPMEAQPNELPEEGIAPEPPASPAVSPTLPI